MPKCIFQNSAEIQVLRLLQSFHSTFLNFLKFLLRKRIGSKSTIQCLINTTTQKSKAALKMCTFLPFRHSNDEVSVVPENQPNIPLAPRPPGPSAAQPLGGMRAPPRIEWRAAAVAAAEPRKRESPTDDGGAPSSPPVTVGEDADAARGWSRPARRRARRRRRRTPRSPGEKREAKGKGGSCIDCACSFERGSGWPRAIRG